MVSKALFLIVLSLGPSAFALQPSTEALSDGWQSVVLIRTEAKDQEGFEAPSYCNATLIGPKLLVTAAHCINHAVLLNAFKMQIEVGKYKYITNPQGQTRRVGYSTYLRKEVAVKYHVTPGLESSIRRSGFKYQIPPEQDVALIEVQEDLGIPADFPFPKVISMNQLRGVTAQPVVYRPTVVTINPTEYITTNDTKRMGALNAVKWNSSGYFESTSTSRVQPGDSGAPLFMQLGSETYLVGVVKGAAKAFWGEWDVFKALDQRFCESTRQLKDRTSVTGVCP